MAKGFIRGTLWGAGISFGAVTLLSLITSDAGLRETYRNGADAARANVEPGGNRGKEGLGPTAVGLATQDVPAPEPDTLAALVADALAPAAVPQAGQATALPQETPEQGTALAGIADPATQGPSVQYVDANGLSTPSTEPEFSISRDPAQPKAPEIISQASAFSEVVEDEEAPNETAELETAELEIAGEEETAAEETTDLAPDVEIAALDTDPVQPVTPVSADPDFGLGAEVEALGTTIPDAAVDLGSAAVKESYDVAALAPDTALTAPTGPGPQVAQSAAQPQHGIPTDTVSDLGVDVYDEADAPEVAALTVLPGPGVKEALSPKEDSQNAQVYAEQSVTAPRSGDLGETQVTTPILTSAVPSFTTDAELLPRVPQSERLVPKEVQTSAEPAEKVAAPVSEEADVTTPDDGVQQAEVRINRLPTLGVDTPDAETTPEPEANAPEADNVTASDADNPLEQFRAEFDAPSEKPLMAVVLIDEGGKLDDSATGLDAVKALPYPVSFAVNALLPDAPERMAAYRAAGFEVLAALDLPPGAAATDAEVNVAFALDKMPEVIGVLEGTGTGVQTTPMAGRQVASILAGTGHGLITQNRGLNTVQKLAVREGVPARTVFRDLDGKGQNEVVIRRFMDQAAFRAGQDNGVVMLARLRQETLAALLSWTLQDRASTVAMAPVSALLLQQP